MGGFDFQGRVVLVTGGARGIGLELTAGLIARGAKVLAVGRDNASLAALSARFGASVVTHAIDLALPDAPAALARWVAAEHPECSALINNAAIMLHTDLTRGGSDHHEEIAREITVNLVAPLQLATALLPVLAQQKSAAIVSITSGLAVVPKRDAAVYCATKAGLRSFTRSLRDQCAKAGLAIQVTEVVMTLVDTTLSRPSALKKYAPARAAADTLAGVERGLDEVWIEKAKILRVLFRLAPGLAYRIMRGG